MARSDRHRRHARVREAAPPGYASAPPPPRLAGVLLDSDVIIESLRGTVAVLDEMEFLDGRGVPSYWCAVSLAEVVAEIRRGEEAVTEAFFEARGEVVLDGAIGRRAGHYLSRYARSHGLRIADALIAAAAATSGLRLWTLNHRHYPMRDLELHRTGVRDPS